MSAPREVFPLLADGSLAIEAEAGTRPLLERWLPLLPYAGRAADPHGARLRLRRRAPHRVAPDDPPALRLGTVSAWIAGDRVRLRGDAGGAARIDLRRRAGGMGAPDTEAGAWEAYSMATLGLALLLGRAGRALVHAAAPVAPDGRAWLLVGDSHAGKTTTCVNLVRAGWSFASDDHVVLSRDGDGGLWVEGLPRHFHVDSGLGSAAPAGLRRDTDPRQAWPGRWVERAPLGGVLLPQVHPHAASSAAPVPAADALAALIRQSPWLLVDRAAAPRLLALLGEAAVRPARALRLGLDTFADPARLESVLARGGVGPDPGARLAGLDRAG